MEEQNGGDPVSGSEQLVGGVLENNAVQPNNRDCETDG